MAADPETAHARDLGQRTREVEGLFEIPVVARCAAPKLVGARLFPEEDVYLARAVPRRRAEFGTARVLAREALRDLGVAPCSLVPRGDRAPWWPVGVVGSISHTAQRCVVVVASAHDVVSIGVDIESEEPLDRELVRLVCTDGEQAWLARMPSPYGSRLSKLIFSAKEALYKCQYPMTGRFLDFRDVELTVELDRGCFRGRIVGSPDPILAARVAAVRGRFLTDGTHVIAAAAANVTGTPSG